MARAIATTLQVTPAAAAGGARVTVSGTGFFPRESVDLRFYCSLNNCDHGTIELGSATADDSGAFSMPVVTPRFSPLGEHGLGAIGLSSGLFAWMPVITTPQPTMQVDPPSGPDGVNVTVSGTGFEANESIPILFYCWPFNCSPGGTLPMGTAQTDQTGAFTLHTTISPFAPAGAHGIGGTGSSSGLFVNTVYTVTSRQAVRLVPDSGLPGSAFTVLGTGFAAGEKVPIKFYCWPDNCGPGAVDLGTATTDDSGSFSLDVHAPRFAPPGPHGVGGTGQTSGLAASAPFTITQNTPTATTTPYPTNTPYPTSTPYPTETACGGTGSTAAGALDVQPTYTPAPTYTPLPTLTPCPSPTSTDTSTPSPTSAASNTPSPTDTPTPASSATATPPPTCAFPHLSVRLTQRLTVVDGSIQATFRNASRRCALLLGVATYTNILSGIRHQHLFDSQQGVIAPGQTLTLSARLPQCLWQADAFYGPVLTPPTYTRQLYDTRIGSQGCESAAHMEGKKLGARG